MSDVFPEHPSEVSDGCALCGKPTGEFPLTGSRICAECKKGTWQTAWTLLVNENEAAAELWADGELRVTVPLTAHQAEQLMGHPVTLLGALEADGLIQRNPEDDR